MSIKYFRIINDSHTSHVDINYIPDLCYVSKIKLHNYKFNKCVLCGKNKLMEDIHGKTNIL